MACTYTGNPALYGVGIRVAFYLLWFGTVLAGWITRPEVPTLRFIHTLFIGATSLSIVILASWNAVFPLDVYITVLLAFGSFYGLVPYYLWRAVTVCNPFTDMGRWPRVRSTGMMRLVFLLLVVSITQPVRLGLLHAGKLTGNRSEERASRFGSGLRGCTRSLVRGTVRHGVSSFPARSWTHRCLLRRTWSLSS